MVACQEVFQLDSFRRLLRDFFLLRSANVGSASGVVCSWKFPHRKILSPWGVQRVSQKGGSKPRSDGVPYCGQVRSHCSSVNNPLSAPPATRMPPPPPPGDDDIPPETVSQYQRRRSIMAMMLTAGDPDRFSDDAVYWGRRLGTDSAKTRCMDLPTQPKKRRTMYLEIELRSCPKWVKDR